MFNSYGLSICDNSAPSSIIIVNLWHHILELQSIPRAFTKLTTEGKFKTQTDVKCITMCLACSHRVVLYHGCCTLKCSNFPQMYYNTQVMLYILPTHVILPTSVIHFTHKCVTTHKCNTIILPTNLIQPTGVILFIPKCNTNRDCNGFFQCHTTRRVWVHVHMYSRVAKGCSESVNLISDTQSFRGETTQEG